MERAEFKETKATRRKNQFMMNPLLRTAANALSAKKLVFLEGINRIWNDIMTMLKVNKMNERRIIKQR